MTPEKKIIHNRPELCPDQRSSDWMDEHAVSLCSPLVEYHRRFSKPFPATCPSFHITAARWNVISVWPAYAEWKKKNLLYQNNWTQFVGFQRKPVLFLAFPPLAHLSCLTVHFSGCPSVYGGVWLASRFLWPLSRHPPWLPAWLMSLRLVFGVIVNYCGAEFPMSPRV